MIVTLTLNPALDRTTTLSAPLAHGHVNRVAPATLQAGGKGVNVSLALAASGVETLALFPAAENDPFTLAVARTGIPFRAIPVAGAVRTNLTIAEPDGTTTKLNEPGPALDADEIARILEAVVETSRGAKWLVLAGSLPVGVDASFYVDVVRAVREGLGDRAPRIAVDTSEAPLQALVAAGVEVDLVKPNAFELASIAAATSGEGAIADGDALELDAELAARAAAAVLARGPRTVLATLGATGAILAAREAAYFAAAPRIEAVSTVGAGDASLAGFLLANVERRALAGQLAQAVAHGAAAASLPGSTPPTREQAAEFAADVLPLPLPLPTTPAGH